VLNFGGGGSAARTQDLQQTAGAIGITTATVWEAVALVRAVAMAMQDPPPPRRPVLVIGR